MGDSSDDEEIYGLPNFRTGREDLSNSLRIPAPINTSTESADRKSPMLDRHDLFATTVFLASDRMQVSERPLQDWPSSASSWLPRKDLKTKRTSTGGSRLGSAHATPPGTAPTAWRKPASARFHKEIDWNASTTSLGGSGTNVSNGSGRSYGVPIRPWRLPRQDAIPCRITGLRADHGGDNSIRIFIRLPGGSRFALWVPPDLPIGPAIPVPYNALTSDETSRPATGASSGRLTPLKALLSQRMGEPDVIDTLIGVQGGIGKHSATISVWPEKVEQSTLSDSLKDLIEAVTGIPADRQKIVGGCRGPLEDVSRPLHKYDIGHGATLLLSIRNPGTRQDVCFLASPALKKQYDVFHSDSIFAHMEEFAKSKSVIGGREAKDIVELLPEWVDILPRDHPQVEAKHSEIMYQDYMFLKDNHIFDLAGRVRKRVMARHSLESSVLRDRHALSS